MRFLIYPSVLVLLITLTACPGKQFAPECIGGFGSKLVSPNINVFKQGKSVAVDNLYLVDFFTNEKYASSEVTLDVSFNGTSLDTIFIYKLVDLNSDYPLTKTNSPKSFKLIAIENNQIVGVSEIQAVKEPQCTFKIIKGKASVEIN
jgi:hypothetical protein